LAAVVYVQQAIGAFQEERLAIQGEEQVTVNSEYMARATAVLDKIADFSVKSAVAPPQNGIFAESVQ